MDDIGITFLKGLIILGFLGAMALSFLLFASYLNGVIGYPRGLYLTLFLYVTAIPISLGKISDRDAGFLMAWLHGFMFMGITGILAFSFIVITGYIGGPYAIVATAIAYAALCPLAIGNLF